MAFAVVGPRQEYLFPEPEFRLRPDLWSFERACYRLWQGNPRRRAQQRREALHRQGYVCFYCDQPLAYHRAQLHHLYRDNTNYEEASDLAAVHDVCHQRMESVAKTLVQSRWQMAGCGCQPRLPMAA